MKNRNSGYKSLFLWAGLAGLTSSVSFAQTSDSLPVRCASHEREIMRAIQDPGFGKSRQKTEDAIQEFLRVNKSQLRTSASDDIIRIPVVVHVIHNSSSATPGGVDNPNITDEQIRSQIAVLNEDYRRKVGTAGFNENPVGVDTGIEFYLAEYDENGRTTNGITRTKYTTKSMFSPITDDALLASIAYWPSDKYLNIWVCRLTGTYLGNAQFPSVENVDGLDTKEQARDKTDGVMIDFRAFGRNSPAITSATYDLGRTTTHEIGHWLGLLHTWGDAVCGTDYCDDTPQAEGSNQTTVCTDKYSRCSGVRTRNMIENYMDYSPDVCMNIFTANQLARMQAVLSLSPRRVKLLENAKDGRLEPLDRLAVDVFPNPANVEINANVRFPDYQNFSFDVYDERGNHLQSQNFVDVWSRRVTVDINKYRAGMYFLRVTTDKETVTKRFVIK